MAQKKYASPHVLGMPRSKALNLTYESLTDFFIRSRSEAYFPGERVTDVERNTRRVVRLHIPVWNGARFKMVLGLKHYAETYRFERKYPLNYPLYTGLEKKTLLSTGVTLNALKSFENGRNFVMVRASADLNGDYRLSQGHSRISFLKYSLSAFYGWKKSQTTAMAVGVAYNYDLGIPNFYPAFLFNHTFNKHWGIESILPKTFRLRYDFSPKAHIYGIVEVEGASYHVRLDEPGFEKYKELELRWSEAKFYLNFEREIYDFLWAGASAGMRTNLRFNLSESNAVRNDFLIRADLNNAFFFNVSLFLVPPRKMSHK